MSIKAELARLRERQRELNKQIRDLSSELANEESRQKSTTHVVEQFSQRKSELAVELCQEQTLILEAQTQKINELKANIKHCIEEESSIRAKIQLYLSDTSFYITEQVSFLVQAFLDYVIEHEYEIGRNMTSKFSISEISEGWLSATKPHIVDVPNGNFVIKFNGKVILQSKDYYFERAIKIAEYDVARKMDKVTIADWYAPYAENFKKAFRDTLKEKFKSKNFALTFTGDSFTLDLL